MKSLNIKIPMKEAIDMDNYADLNPQSITKFIVRYFQHLPEVVDKPITQLTSNYTFKIDDDLHKLIKIKSIELNIPMNELIGRLIEQYYRK